MYADRFILCLKHDGKILRDSGGVVNVPFGVEYGIFLKNLNSVRAVAKVSVDGKDASGAGLIIPANGSVDLERFITNGNLDRGNKFKFIERTAGIEAHKGIGADDGLVRVEFFAEKVIQKQTVVTEHIHHHHNQHHPWYPNIPWWPYNGYLGQSFGTLRQSDNIGAQEASFSYGRAQGGSSVPGSSVNMSEAGVERGGSHATNSAPQASLSGISGQSRILRSAAMNTSIQAAVSDVGITVAGAQSSQKFSIGEHFPLETVSHVIVLQLRGVVGDKKVTRAVTVKSKNKCTSCGFPGKSAQKFCSKCGTALEII